MSKVATADECAWAEDVPAMTVTFVGYAGPVGDVLRAAGVTWESSARATFDAAPDLVGAFDPDRGPLLVGPSDGWLVLLAPNGFEFSYPGVAAGASRLGRTVSVCWNVNAVMRSVVADRGPVTRSFDPLLGDPSEGVALPE